MRYLVLTVLALALVSAASSPQGRKDNWENLKQLQPGHKIKIVDMNLKSWDGRLASVSEEAITIRELRQQQEITVERANVFRVTDLEASRRGRNALIGFAAGIVVGAVWATRQEEDVGTLLPVLLVGGVFGGGGAGVGALVPSYPTIYRAQHGPPKSTVEPPGLPPPQ
ncbi:MAG: hypothetical protein ABSA41_17340 [Terriglobia bacterium]|jgi:hypothetical protein